MAAKKKTSNKSPLVGTVTKPITLDQTTKLYIDTNKKIVDNIIEASIGGNLNTAELEQFTAISNSRDQVYQLIDTMMKDSVVSSIVRTYAEDACEVADNGHIIWCESNDPNISKFVNYLLNIMNVDKNIFSWVYSLIKYGDVLQALGANNDWLRNDKFSLFITEDKSFLLNSLTSFLKEEGSTFENNKMIISSMGTGNKLDPSKFQIKDISKTEVCPLAKKVRLELRKKGIKGVKTLFSTEEPIKSENFIASVSFVPSVEGLLIAREVILDLKSLNN